jgi:purine-nucleoside phosphorylase
MPDSKMTVFVEDKKLKAAETYIRSRVQVLPRLAIVLGSGLGYFAEQLEVLQTFSYKDVPWYPQTTVEGHSGRLIFGQCGRIPILVAQGRLHYYESKSLEQVTFPVQLFARLGIHTLILTNAAGGVRSSLRPGDFVLLEDFINFGQIEVLPGEKLPKTVFLQQELIERAEKVAADQGIHVSRGVYCWTTGPSYETPAEVRLISKLGGDVVGMSTVPEIIMAAYFHIQVLAISLVTNLAAGISVTPLTHAEVQETARRIRKPYSRFITGVIAAIAATPPKA